MSNASIDGQPVLLVIALFLYLKIILKLLKYVYMWAIDDKIKNKEKCTQSLANFQQP